MKLIETKHEKRIASDNYNLYFNKQTGFTIRYGSNIDDDPQYCPFGPEILDLEISSAAADDILENNPFHIVTNHGCRGLGCKQFCYKANKTGKSVHMSLDTFKAIMDRMPKTLCSIAFGVLSPIEQHPQVWEIFEECRKRGVIPCVTINQEVSRDVAANLARLCDAVAVSVNQYNKEGVYNTINTLSRDYDMKQINIHIVLSADTVPFIKSVIDDMKSDPRLSKMNALVMLSFKDKAGTNSFAPITSSYYKDVVEYALCADIKFGFDSCGANTFIASIRDTHPELIQYCEPCESLLFSAYIDVNARLYACSFTEKTGMWLDGIDVLRYNDFIDIWNCSKVAEWRKELLSCGRSCPVYEIGV